MTSSRRFFLRQSTADDHQRLDDMIETFSNRAAYAGYLQSIYAFRMPLERQLGALDMPRAWAPWRPVEVGMAMERDLRSLDLESPVLDGEAMPLGSVEALLGMLYTLEGSGLGAQVLLRRAEALGIGEANGASHLARQAGALGNWRGFLEILDQAEHVDMDAVAAASRDTFARARNSFGRFVREQC